MRTPLQSQLLQHAFEASLISQSLQLISYMTTTVRIGIYVQPRASKTSLAGMHDGNIKVRLAAPPVEGAANAALVEFLAQRLGIAKSRVQIVAGLSSRRKTVQVEGLSADAIAAALS